ncbi:MAG: hypothetical protein KME27_28390 [Lyngbya sp. HA4199-MV5]|nr:hypothetical protein [Lyngbya sp. HA4199-MV5]
MSHDNAPLNARRASSADVLDDHRVRSPQQPALKAPITVENQATRYLC